MTIPYRHVKTETHVMLDLETWGTAIGSAIRSIGAVHFDPSQPRVSVVPFHANITRESCTMYGMPVDAATEKWWQEQYVKDPKLIEQFADLQVGLVDALERFDRWLAAVANADGRKVEDIFLWSHGAAFDIPMLAAAYAAVRRKVPWSYRNSRDTRTLYDAAGITRADHEVAKQQHHPVDDARAQAATVRKAYDARAQAATVRKHVAADQEYEIFMETILGRDPPHISEVGTAAPYAAKCPAAALNEVCAAPCRAANDAVARDIAQAVIIEAQRQSDRMPRRPLKTIFWHIIREGVRTDWKSYRKITRT